MKNIIIIGGGIGGLFTGAILAKEGYNITLFEKNVTIGGGLQTFNRNGYEFETGMHIIGGLGKYGILKKICTYLGIYDEIEYMNVDEDCMDTIHFASDNYTYKIAPGRDGFINSLSKEFPEERENIKLYVDALYEITDKINLYNLKPSDSFIETYPESFLIPTNKFIENFTSNLKLREILAYMNPMYAGDADHTPVYIHALLNVLYINGPARFIGGSQQLADLLVNVIINNGGKILNNNPIIHIEIGDKEIQYVEDKNGTKYTADKYISAIHPTSLLNIVDDKAFPRSYRNRLNSIPNSYSAFTIYIVLKENSFPYINHTCYYQDDYGKIWDYGKDDNEWPHGFMYMTPPIKNQGKYAEKLIITSPMNFNAVKKWENTKVGKRGEEYENWKKECTEKALLKIETLYPDIREKIKLLYTSSPLTIRDYYNVKEGSMYGYTKDCENIMLSKIPVNTKVKNLLLTGQNINLHGICGVPLTAINTAEAILGLNTIINKLSNQQ